MYGGRSIDGLVGRFERERSVRPVPVVVQERSTKDTLEMASAEDQEMVEAVGAYGPSTAPQMRSRSVPAPAS